MYRLPFHRYALPCSLPCLARHAILPNEKSEETRDEEERLKEELHCRVMKITRQWKSTIRTSAWEAISLANMKKFTGKISGYLKRERVFTWLRDAVNIVCSLDTMWLRDAVVMSAHNWPDHHWVLSSSVVRASDYYTEGRGFNSHLELKMFFYVLPAYISFHLLS